MTDRDDTTEEKHRTLWYLSFVEGDKWLGGTIVKAPDLAGAIKTAWRLGVNPGGQVASQEFTLDELPEGKRDNYKRVANNPILLTRKEVGEL